MVAYDIQIHMDEHFAFQLTQEQRVEFQNQLKRNIPSTTPVAKKQKTSIKGKSSKAPTKSKSIQKFLAKPSDVETQMATASTSAANEMVETEKCAECGKNIPIVDLFEHSDFHVAQKLHDELIKAEIGNRTNNNTIQSNAAVVSNGKKSTKKSNTNSTKNILSFFQNS